jgi:hypothetical protein
MTSQHLICEGENMGEKRNFWKGERDELAWLPENPHIMEISKEGKTEEL